MVPRSTCLTLILLLVVHRSTYLTLLLLRSTYLTLILLLVVPRSTYEYLTLILLPVVPQLPDTDPAPVGAQVHLTDTFPAPGTV